MAASSITDRELVRLKAVEAATAELLTAWAARPFDPRKTREIRARLATLVLPPAVPVRACPADRTAARLPYTD